MVFIQLFFLIYLLYTAERYLVMKISSKEHRLLPVIIVLAGLFNFYRVVECVTDTKEVFVLLEQLLVFQVIFGVIHYKKDFLRIKFFKGGNVLLFVSLVVFDAALVLQYKVNQNTGFIFHVFLSIYIIVLLVMDIYIGVRIKLKKREKIIGYSIFASFLLVLISGIATNPLRGGWSMILTPFALFIVEINLNMLMKSGYIVDSAYLLKAQMYDNSSIITILYDEEGYLIDLNDAASKTFPDIKPSNTKDMGKCYNQELKKILSEEHKDNEIEIRGCVYRQHLAQEFYMGHLRGYILYLVDLTQEKQENLLMESLMQEAESATAMKSRFLASMSHELRSPLHAIIGFCDILNRQEDISEHNKNMVGNIYSAGNTLLQLVNAILDYSKMEAGKLELKSETYDFEKMLQNIFQESLINRKDKSIQITLNMQTDYPKYLRGDELRVRDIVQNLMSNAVKYTDEGSVECRVSCESVNDQKMKVNITVIDTGIGISSEQLEVVFQEYTSFVGKKNVEGTGLGLPIVKQLTEMMGGDVSAESTEGSGTTVHVCFYQETVDKNIEPAQLITEHKMKACDTNTNSMVHPEWSFPDAKVLVVDDMEVNLELFREFTDIWSVQLDTAMSGEEAIERVKQNTYDIVFLDNMMPMMSGLEAASIIKGVSDVPLYILTADISEETKKKSAENGAKELLEKPLRLEELKRVLEGELPESKRVTITREYDFSKGARQKKVIHTFVRETEAIQKNIVEAWEQSDLDLFRVKVHGLKGTSRGIGLDELSEQAEIMEMAAKTENKQFIENHLEALNQCISQTLEQLKVEIEASKLEEKDKIQQKNEMEISSEQSSSMVTTDELFKALQTAFDSYDLTSIEKCLVELKQCILSQEEQELVKQLYEAAEDMEYEKGSELLK